MNRFTFSRGQWTDGMPLPEWDDGEDADAYRERLGYATPRFTIGREHGSNIEIYEATEGTTFLATVCPFGSSCFDVYLPDFPSLMLFMKEYGPTFSALNLESHQEALVSIVEKAFRATHGHSAYNICPRCDPEGWSEQVELAERRAQAKAKSKAKAN